MFALMRSTFSVSSGAPLWLRTGPADWSRPATNRLGRNGPVAVAVCVGHCFVRFAIVRFVFFGLVSGLPFTFYYDVRVSSNDDPLNNNNNSNNKKDRPTFSAK